MTVLRGLFSSGRVVDLLLVVIAAEFVWLSWRCGARDLRTVMIDLFFSLAPGACLLLALRAALTGAGWPWIAAFLAASFPVHILDLARRRR